MYVPLVVGAKNSDAINEILQLPNLTPV